MKKILAMAAVAALAAGASVYAANPFSDVSTSDWAYQAVSDLSDQGIVEGYPDGTFKGQSNITRYEMAQIIARLMAKEDQYNAEQRATIDKLAGEYADELDSLGVRVSNLEKKVGNISWSGNARMRWNQAYDDKNLGKAYDKYNGRIKIIAQGQVNENTKVVGRFVTNMNFKDGSSADTQMDNLYVEHKFGDKATVNLGRFDYFAGQTGLFFDDELDGVQVTLGGDNLALDLGYGRFYVWDAEDGIFEKVDPEVALARVRGNAGKLAYDVEYYHIANNSVLKDDANIVGAGLTYGVTDAIDVFGDFYQNTTADNDPKAWTAGLGYGHFSWAKPGSFRVAAQYIKAEHGAFFGGTTFTTSGPLDEIVDFSDTNNVKAVKYWMASLDYGLAKNVKLHAEYSFNVKADGVDTDYDDLATVSLNYVF